MLPLVSTWTRMTSPHWPPFMLFGSVGQPSTRRYGLGSSAGRGYCACCARVTLPNVKIAATSNQSLVSSISTSPGQRVCNTIVLEKQQKTASVLVAHCLRLKHTSESDDGTTLIHHCFCLPDAERVVATAQNYRGEAVPVGTRTEPIEFSQLRFLTFVFGREGPMDAPLSTPPVSGREYFIEADVFGIESAASIRFQVVDTDNRALRTLTMWKASDSSD